MTAAVMVSIIIAKRSADEDRSFDTHPCQTHTERGVWRSVMG